METAYSMFAKNANKIYNLMVVFGQLVKQELLTLPEHLSFLYVSDIFCCCSIISFVYSVFSVLLRFTLHHYPYGLFKYFQTNLRGRRGRVHIVVGFYNYLCNWCLLIHHWCEFESHINIIFFYSETTPLQRRQISAGYQCLRLIIINKQPLSTFDFGKI